MHRLFVYRFLVWSAAICVGFSAVLAAAQELRLPSSATVGEDASISTSGSGKGTFYLVGPGVSQKRDVTLGEDIHLQGNDLQYAGGYTVMVCSSECQSGSFFVNPAKTANIAFLVHPSRVPVALGDAVSGVAFPYDKYGNLVLTPETVEFQFAAKNAASFSKSVQTRGGIAWFRTASGKSAGTVNVIASIGDVSSKRALQQVASEPCNLRIEGQRTAKGIVVQTEPVHDCSGNIVPDGTIVTFTASDAEGKSSVDAPIKAGIARAQMDTAGPATVTVASGVVMGNELRIGGQP